MQKNSNAPIYSILFINLIGVAIFYTLKKVVGNMKQKEILKKIRENNNLKEVYSDSQYKMIDELMALVEEIKTLNIVEQSVAYLLPHAIDKLCAILELDTKIKTQEEIIKKLTSKIKEIRSEEEFELLFSEDGIPIF